MKILIATPLYPPDIGGPATLTEFFERELPRRGIRITVAAFGSVRHLPPLIRHLVYGFRVWRKARPTDIVLALDPLGIGVPALIAARIAGTRFFVRVAGDRAWEHENRHSEGENRTFVPLEVFQAARLGPRTMLRRKLQTFVCTQAERVIVPSEFLGKIVVGWGVSPEKIKVIYNAFDEPNEQESRAEARSLLGLSGSVVVSAGRLVPWKGFRALVEGMPEVRRAFPDAELFIAGDGPEYPALREKIKERGAEIFVHLLEACPRETLHRFLAAADVFVLNTGYEGLSHQIIEAMACGAPVVTTDIPGNRELVEHEVNGLLVPYNDRTAIAQAIIRLLQDRTAAAHLAAAGQKTVSRFSTAAVVEAFVNVFSRD